MCQKIILVKTVSFSIESTFPNYSGSPFSEGPDSGPYPIYKVCSNKMKKYTTLILEPKQA